MGLFEIKTWNNKLSTEETFEAYKLLKKLIKCSSFEGNRKGIKRNFLLKIGDFDISTSLEQIYTEFGMIPEEACSYYGHYENIKKIFGTDRHIVEISCGYFPVLANMIAREQIRTKTGTITAIDKSLFITKPRFDNMTLIRDEFTLDTNPKSLGLDLNSSDNLLVAIAPCEATQAIIDYAIKHGLDFYIAFCSCAYFEEPRFFRPTRDNVEQIYKDKYIEPALRRTKKRKMDKIQITYLNDAYYGNTSFGVPIIYSRKKQR